MWGHYTSLVKGRDGTYWHLDDAQVQKVGWEQVQEGWRGGVTQHGLRESPYLLVYQKC